MIFYWRGPDALFNPIRSFCELIMASGLYILPSGSIPFTSFSMLLYITIYSIDGRMDYFMTVHNLSFGGVIPLGGLVSLI